MVILLQCVINIRRCLRQNEKAWARAGAWANARALARARALANYGQAIGKRWQGRRQGRGQTIGKQLANDGRGVGKGVGKRWASDWQTMAGALNNSLTMVQQSFNNRLTIVQPLLNAPPSLPFPPFAHCLPIVQPSFADASAFPLLYCDGFCQVSWHVYVAAALSCHVVGEELERYYGYEGE